MSVSEESNSSLRDFATQLKKSQDSKLSSSSKVSLVNFYTQNNSFIIFFLDLKRTAEICLGEVASEVNRRFRLNNQIENWFPFRDVRFLNF